MFESQESECLESVLFHKELTRKNCTPQPIRNHCRPAARNRALIKNNVNSFLYQALVCVVRLDLPLKMRPRSQVRMTCFEMLHNAHLVLEFLSHKVDILEQSLQLLTDKLPDMSDLAVTTPPCKFETRQIQSRSTSRKKTIDEVC